MNLNILNFIFIILVFNIKYSLQFLGNLYKNTIVIYSFISPQHYSNFQDNLSQHYFVLFDESVLLQSAIHKFHSY